MSIETSTEMNAENSRCEYPGCTRKAEILSNYCYIHQLNGGEIPTIHKEEKKDDE